MSGRLEEELRIEQMIQNIIKDQPNIIKDYADSFIDKTYNTKKHYIINAIQFVSFITEKYNIDFDNPESIKTIKALHINAFVKHYTYKEDNTKNTNSYLSNKLSAVKNFFEFLVDNDIIDINPCVKVKNPKDKRLHEITYLTEEEIKIVESNIENGVGSKKAINYQKKWINRDKGIVFLGIATGLRVSAICNINIEDISFKNKTIRVVEKGDIEKFVYVADNVLDLLKEWMKDREKILDDNSTNALFISSQKKRITTSAIRLMLDKYTYNINKKITPHKLRSTTATVLLDKTDNIYLVADVLGHKNIQNTKRYAKMQENKKKDASDILGSILN